MEQAETLSPALEAVLDRFRGMVRSVGWRHGLGDQEVDELFQAVRLRLWRARESPEQIEATPASYVYRTALTATLDLIRARRARREDPIDVVTNARVSGPGTPGADAGTLTGELETIVARAVDDITTSRRPVVRMYLAGYGREEIAGLLGWSEAKTRNLLYRGLADLRERLLAQGIGPGGLS